MTKQGLLLLNLGTPAAPTKKAVKAYLKEFLNDPRVIDLPTLIRFILVNAFIIPFRSKASAHAYQSIWTEAGSPLLCHGKNLEYALQSQLGSDYVVVLGMRYGEPSIAQAIQKMKISGCETITVFPLFPHYASASTGSALEQTLRLLASEWNIPSIRVIHDYFDHPAYIGSLATQMRDYLEQQTIGVDHILFSYHGIPVRHIQKSGCQATCHAPLPCPTVQANNRFCYRAQCYATTQAVATLLRLPQDQYSVSFQSRLGRTPWIAPYTDEILPKLALKSFKRLAIVCPAFTADCLETLEEIGIRAQEQWLSLGGESLVLIPCLNTHPDWVSAIMSICFDQSKS